VTALVTHLDKITPQERHWVEIRVKQVTGASQIFFVCNIHDAGKPHDAASMRSALLLIRHVVQSGEQFLRRQLEMKTSDTIRAARKAKLSLSSSSSESKRVDEPIQRQEPPPKPTQDPPDKKSSVRIGSPSRRPLGKKKWIDFIHALFC
jgi:hypothetical protein